MAVQLRSRIFGREGHLEVEVLYLRPSLARVDGRLLGAHSEQIPVPGFFIPIGIERRIPTTADIPQHWQSEAVVQVALSRKGIGAFDAVARDERFSLRVEVLAALQKLDEWRLVAECREEVCASRFSHGAAGKHARNGQEKFADPSAHCFFREGLPKRRFRRRSACLHATLEFANTPS